MQMILNAADEFDFRFAEALRRLRNERFAAEAKQRVDNDLGCVR
mgnify:CR=1 FL=1|jgi:hypothetical protein